MLLGRHLERLLGPSTSPMAGDVIIILGSAHHLNRNHTCCIKHYRPSACHSPRNVHASAAQTTKMRNKKTCDIFFNLFFSFPPFLVRCWCNSMGPKPMAAMESIKSQICYLREAQKSYDTLMAGTKWRNMKKLWNYILRELSTSFGICQGRLFFNDLCVWGCYCLCLTMDACNARSWPGAIRSG